MEVKINQRTDKEWDAFTATMFAEGALDGENATPIEQIEAWAWLIKSGLAWQLQGYFGRGAQTCIDHGYITREGDIKWTRIDDALEKTA